MSPRLAASLRLQLLLATLLLVVSSPLALRAQTAPPQTLEAGDANQQREIMSGERQVYTITLAAGQCLTFKLDQRGIDLALSAYDPGGIRVLETSGVGGPLAQRDLALVADLAGVYRLEVRPIKESGAAGYYVLREVEVRSATERDRTRFAAQTHMSRGEDLTRLNTAEARRDAINRYTQARALWRDAGDHWQEASTLISIGRIHMTLAQYQKALEALNEALSVARAAHYQQGEAESLANLATLYLDLGDTQKALELNQAALPLLDALGNREDEGAALSNMGLIYSKNPDDSQKALEFYNRALLIFQEIGQRQREAVTLNNIGSVYRTRGELKKSLDFFERALVIRREVGDRQGEAATLNNLGQVYEAQGEYEKGLDYYQRAASIVHDVGYRRGEALALQSAARVLDKLGRTTEAVARVEEALRIVESLRNDLIGEEDRATFFASTEFFYKFYIDLLMKLHAQRPSDGYLDRALQANERAHARNLLEQLNEARVNLRQDVDPALLKEERRIEQQLNSAAQKEALQKSAYTPEQLAASQKELASLIDKYQELEARLRASSPRYAALTRPQLIGVAEIQKSLLDQDTLLLEYALGPDRSYLWLVSQSTVEGFILPKRAQVEQLCERFYNLLAARARHLKFETPEEKRLRVASADAELTKVAAELSSQLLGPVAARLGSKRLLIVGDGLLHLVPFAALADPSDSSRPLVLDHELVSVPSASALLELRRQQQGRGVAPKAVAVLADPVFDTMDERVKNPARAIAASNASADYLKAQAQQSRSISEVTRSARETGAATDGDSNRGGEGVSIPRLPFTRQEARAITALIPAQQREEALDFEASRETATSARLGQYRFIHFATHGLLNSEHPELSGIVLSLVDRDGREQDGFLRASEIFHLKLPAELVTLSGCRTGLGKQMSGEGMVGLTQGFMYAGAARVMVSLWDVNDQATADFMGRFYKFMLGPQHLSPAAALRATQISISQDERWKSPYYWSAFILQGEPR